MNDTPPIIRYSCVVDRDPIFAYQAWVWAVTLIHLAEVDPRDLLVHVVRGTPARNLAQLEAMGIAIRQVEPFDRRHGYSNKLRQLESPELAEADYAVLSDADIAFAGRLREFCEGDVYAKRVDTGIPSLRRWKEIFVAAGFTDEPKGGLSTNTRRPTFVHNFNGGLIVASSRAFRELADLWPRWHRWLLERPSVLRRNSVVADQMSLALAVHSAGLRVQFLNLEENFPTQHPAVDSISPVALHYHRRFAPNGDLLMNGARGADAAIARVNSLLRDQRRGHDVVASLDPIHQQ